MGIAKDMGILAQGIIDSYEERVKNVSSLMEQVNELLKNFHLEREKMAGEIRDRLAKAECLRKKDFDIMMEIVRVPQREREKEVAQMLERFRKEEQEMVDELRDMLVSGKRTRPQDFEIMKENILTRQKEREQEVSVMLRDFHLEQEELGTGLRRLLQKGESIRIKDFKVTINSIRIRQKERESEVGIMLEDFQKVREEVNAEWQNVMATMKRRKQEDQWQSASREEG